MAGKNLASKYSSKVDERFARESLVMAALNNDYAFTGVDTVNVYSIPVVPMRDYTRSGTSRYGTPDDLQRNVQTMTVKRDRAFTFVIDRGDKIQSQMVSDAGRALSRQTNEVWIPEFDSYVLRTLAHAASLHGGFSDKAITKSNAYECFLEGQEYMGEHNVPENGRVAFCSYRFANLLKQDPAFIKNGDAGQQAVVKGCIGEVDGTKIIKVPSSRLPAGCAFILTHPCAATAPKQLNDYKIHDNPPGINGWLVEGRVIYDAFVLEEKKNAIYYHGKQGVLKTLTVMTSPISASESAVMVTTEVETGNSFVYKLYTKAEDKPAVTYGTALSGWTTLPAGGKISASGGYVAVAEVGSDNKPVGVGTAEVHVG